MKVSINNGAEFDFFHVFKDTWRTDRSTKQEMKPLMCIVVVQVISSSWLFFSVKPLYMAVYLLFPAPLSPIIRILRVVKTSLSSTVTILIVFSGTDSFHLNPSVLLFVSLWNGFVFTRLMVHLLNNCVCSWFSACVDSFFVLFYQHSVYLFWIFAVFTRVTGSEYSTT